VIQLIQRQNYVSTLMGIIPPADTVYNLVLAAGVSQTVDVPSGATTVLMTGEVPYFVKYGPGPVNIPAQSVTDGTGLEVNPAGRSLAGISAITVVARMAGVVQLAFYNG
jgi:hypothetical protein